MYNYIIIVFYQLLDVIQKVVDGLTVFQSDVRLSEKSSVLLTDLILLTLHHDHE